MHVYFLVIFHCLLDKEMEIYVTCILKVYETAPSEIPTSSYLTLKCIKD